MYSNDISREATSRDVTIGKIDRLDLVATQKSGAIMCVRTEKLLIRGICTVKNAEFGRFSQLHKRP